MVMLQFNLLNETIIKTYVAIIRVKVGSSSHYIHNLYNIHTLQLTNSMACFN